jgi:5-methyltetrahydrofolate--homocysteine methyltransferase
MATLKQLIDERVLILDGAMGTMIQRYNLSEQDFRGERFAEMPGQMKGNNDLLCLTRPDVIKDIHHKYLEAGADIIETNTFNAQRVSMADYHMQDLCREINLAAAGLAREMADEYTAKTPHKPRFVAGSVGPTNKTCSMSPDVNNPALRALTYDELAAAYQEQMEALLEGGVDALLIETIFDSLNAKAAIYAAETAMKKIGREVPLMLSVTVSDIAGRTLSGQTLDAFLASVQHAPIFSIGHIAPFAYINKIHFGSLLQQLQPGKPQPLRSGGRDMRRHPGRTGNNQFLIFCNIFLRCTTTTTDNVY